MSEAPPGCGPHRKAASFRLSPVFSIEQTVLFCQGELLILDIKRKMLSILTGSCLFCYTVTKK